MEITHESLIGTYEQKRAVVAQFNLMDDIFCSVVLRDKAASEYLLSGLLGRPIKVIDHRTQYAIRNIEGHSVVLDFYAEDETHNQFVIEVHLGNVKFPELNMRYYHTAVDWSTLAKSVPYDKMPDLYMINISDVDLFDTGENFCEAVITIDKKKKPYNDKIHRMYFNTAVKDDTWLTELLQYLANSDPKNESFGALSQVVKQHKIKNEGVDTMCKALEDYANQRREEILAEGITKGKIETVKNMLKDKVPFDTALKYTGLDKQTYEKYADQQ